MPTTIDKNRQRIREILDTWRSTPRIARDAAHANCLRQIGADGVLTSPKVYESGLVTNFDLRLVDLYSDEPVEGRDLTAATGGDEIGC